MKYVWIVEAEYRQEKDMKTETFRVLGGPDIASVIDRVREQARYRYGEDVQIIEAERLCQLNWVGGEPPEVK